MAYVKAHTPYKAAEIASRSPRGSQKVAKAALARAQALAATHVQSGAYLDSLEVVQEDSYTHKYGGTVLNWYVKAGDPQARRIEYGHQSRSGSWVEGQYILTRAKEG